MKQWTLALAIACALAAATGCQSDAQTPKASAAAPVSADAPQSQDDAPAARVAAPVGGGSNGDPGDEASDKEARLSKITVSDAAVKQIAGEKKGQRLWEVTATVRNGSASALPGVELVADLTKPGEDHAFARSSAEVRFDAPLQPGKSFAWRSLSPVVGKSPPEAATVAVKATRWLEPTRSADTWKPLDPKTATPKTVGETMTVPMPATAKSSR